MSGRQEIVRPVKRVRGEVVVPSDKSITHRALIFGSLAKGKGRVERPLRSEDTLSTAGCLKALGIKITEDAKGWVVEGRGLWGYTDPRADLNCGNSGTTIRLISGPLAAQNFPVRLVGDASLSRRPMKRVVEPLSRMGAEITATNGDFAPLGIRGRKPLKAIAWESPVASAQVKSCVILAALHAEGKTIYKEPFLSRDHTERMLSDCGVALKRSQATVEIEGPTEPRARDWVVPGDPSSAAFFQAAAALLPGSEMLTPNISLNETRTGFLRALKAMGADISFQTETSQGGDPIGNVLVKGTGPLKAITVEGKDVVDMIDEIPVLSVLATQAHGRTTIRGAAELRVKESDRLKAVATELRKMGGSIEELPDGLIIEGPTPLLGQTVNTYGDHRLAMALAVAGLVAMGETCILDAGCVDISFSRFLGAMDTRGPVSEPHLAPKPVRTCLYWLGKHLFLWAGYIFWRLKIRGTDHIPRTGPVIIASNHVSFGDPPMVGASIPRQAYFFAKQQLFDVPIMGWLIRQVNVFPVQREKQGISALKNAQRLLKSGEAVVLFPEGTRSKTGRLGKAKPGVGLLAAMTDAVVIPTYVHNTDKMKQFKKVEIHFGAPLRYKGHNDYQHFSDTILEKIRQLQEEVERVA